MKKNLIRAVALVLLAVMVLSCIPAYASGIIGTISSTTKMYEKARTSSDVVAEVKGTVNVLYQNNDGTMYQVSLNYNGKTYTGWVPASAVSNIGRSSSSGSGTVSSGSTTGSTTSSATYTGSISSSTNVYNDKGKSVGAVRGPVTVNHRNADGTQLYITASDGTNTVSGWVPASSVSSLYKKGSGSIKVSDLPTSGTGTAATGSYSAYAKAVNGVSGDSTIYIRPTATGSTSGATKIRNAKGLTFTILGESGDYYYASYNGTTGFVRKRDFTLSSGTTGTTGSTSGSTSGAAASYTKYDKAKAATSNDRTIYMRVNPDKSSAKENIVVKVTNARGAAFSLLGENGDWYYAQYILNGATYNGFVRKQDFTVNDGTVPNTNTGTTTNTSGYTYAKVTGTKADAWGYIKRIPGTNIGSDYGKLYDNNIYCNGLNSKGTDYYYNAYSGKKNYFFSLMPQNADTAVISGHNMRSSKTGFNNLHNVQDKLRSGGSSADTIFEISYGGKTKWQVVCFFELNEDTMRSASTRKAAQQTIVLGSYGTSGSSKSAWLNTVMGYASSTYKGAKVSSASASDKLMLLYTCGDYGNGEGRSAGGYQNLYFLLKAIG